MTIATTARHEWNNGKKEGEEREKKEGKKREKRKKDERYVPCGAPACCLNNHI